ncbi:MAG: hypothetical protein U0798_20355 [Gemmataceae bacterium]
MAKLNLDFSDYHRTIIGYHGTSLVHADRLVAGEAFEKSDNDNEWFGKGVYFWEHAPKQAWWWAKEIRKHKHPAVVGAIIRLGNCFDLLDTANVKILKEFYAMTAEKADSSGNPLPENYRRHMRLDCAIFNMFYGFVDESKTPIDSARGVYVPTDTKKRIWKGSWLYDDSHIQICVRNTRSILAVWHVRQDGHYGRPSQKAEAGQSV